MIAHRIAQLRHRIGWSQTQLAKAMNVNLTTVRKWESGISDPSAQNIIRLYDLFGVSADYLLGKDDMPSIYIGALSKDDQKKISAMVQVYINLSTK